MLFSRKPQQPLTAQQLLEEDLRTAYKHLERLQKVNTGNFNLNVFPNYVMAYWMIRDRIKQLEQQYEQMTQ